MTKFLDWLLGRKFYEFSVQLEYSKVTLASRTRKVPAYFWVTPTLDPVTLKWTHYPVKVREITRAEYEASR